MSSMWSRIASATSAAAAYLRVIILLAVASHFGAGLAKARTADALVAGDLPKAVVGLAGATGSRVNDLQGDGGEGDVSLVLPTGGTASMLFMRRISDDGLGAPWSDFALPAGAMLGVLALFGVAYAAMVRRDMKRWIKGIEAAARAYSLNPQSIARAPIDPTMPLELRGVAEAYNAMAEGMQDRQRAILDSVAENRKLMLEMHHRIKNALQVIQSYMALIRRSAERKNDAATLIRVEVRVGVIAVAYRHALTSSGIRPLRVSEFLEEIAAGAVAGLRRPEQRATLAFDWNGELEVDRAIPLGLAMVEALIAAFAPADARNVRVLVAPDGSEIVVRVTSDGTPTDNSPPPKIMQGLAGQLVASPAPQEAADILHWRFSP